MNRPYRGPVDWRGLPVRRPFPWERDMTVCIAAICTDSGEHKIVLCTDTRIGGDLGSSEGFLKEIAIGGGWYCLIAGDEGDILAISRLYRAEFLKASSDLRFDTLGTHLQAPMFKRKAMLADEYTRLHHAMSYEDFLNTGKDRLPDDIFRESSYEIKNLRLNAEVIVAGILHEAGEIHWSDSKGKIRAAANFAAVGSGEYLAASSLLQRNQNSAMSLATTLFNVYEAKRLAQKVGSVGPYSMLSVLTKAGKAETVAKTIRDQLDGLCSEYGSKPVPIGLKLEGSLF